MILDTSRVPDDAAIPVGRIRFAYFSVFLSFVDSVIERNYFEPEAIDTDGRFLERVLDTNTPLRTPSLRVAKYYFLNRSCSTINLIGRHDPAIPTNDSSVQGTYIQGTYRRFHLICERPTALIALFDFFFFFTFSSIVRCSRSTIRTREQRSSLESPSKASYQNRNG